MTDSEHNHGGGAHPGQQPVQPQPQQNIPAGQQVPAQAVPPQIPAPQQVVANPPVANPVGQPAIDQAQQAFHAPVPPSMEAVQPPPMAQQIPHPPQALEPVPQQMQPVAPAPVPQMAAPQPDVAPPVQSAEFQQPLDDYQYPQGDQVIPEMPAVAVPPSQSYEHVQQPQPQQPVSAEYAAPDPMDNAGEQISQRLAQLQSQYDTELAAEYGTPEVPMQAQAPAQHYAPAQPSFDQAYQNPEPVVSEEFSPAYQPQPSQEYQSLAPDQSYAPQMSAPAVSQDHFEDYGAMPGEAAQSYGYDDPLQAGLSPIGEDYEQGGGVVKKIMLGGAFVAALAVGGGTAYTYQYTDFFGDSTSSGPAPTIKAASSPIRIVKSKLSGAKERLNKSMHSRLGGGDGANSGQETVTRSIRLSSNTTGGSGISAADFGDLPDGSGADSSASSSSKTPRRVKTLIVKPDGTIMQPAGGAAVARAKETRAAPVIKASAIQKVKSVARSSGSGIRRMKTIREVSDARRLAQGQVKSVETQAGQTRAITRKSRVASIARPQATPKRAVLDRGPVRGNVGDPFVVQVTSRTSQTGALAAFADMQQKYPGLVGSFTPDIERADLGAKGVWYRLRVGPVLSKSAAVDLCSNLKEAGHPGCFVRRK